jgi:Ca2+-binding RTX toxin-like protein
MATIFGTPGNDTIYGTSDKDLLSGRAGNDTLYGQDGNDSLFGGDGNDTIRGGNGDDFLYGEGGVDTLTGDAGKDTFVFEGTPTDIVTDFQFGQDKLAYQQGSFNQEDVDTGFAGRGLQFQKGVSSQLSGDSNLLVLTDPFPNAAAAAQAIADNDALTAKQGLFAYYNSTLGFARFVLSSDLSNGVGTNVLANLTNVTDPASMNNFSAQDFAFFALT